MNGPLHYPEDLLVHPAQAGVGGRAAAGPGLVPSVPTPVPAPAGHGCPHCGCVSVPPGSGAAAPVSPRAKTVLILAVLALVAAPFTLGLSLLATPLLAVGAVWVRHDILASSGRWGGLPLAVGAVAVSGIGMVLLTLLVALLVLMP